MAQSTVLLLDLCTSDELFPVAAGPRKVYRCQEAEGGGADAPHRFARVKEARCVRRLSVRCIPCWVVATNKAAVPPSSLDLTTMAMRKPIWILTVCQRSQHFWCPIRLAASGHWITVNSFQSTRSAAQCRFWMVLGYILALGAATLHVSRPDPNLWLRYTINLYVCMLRICALLIKHAYICISNYVFCLLIHVFIYCMKWTLIFTRNLTWWSQM